MTRARRTTRETLAQPATYVKAIFGTATAFLGALGVAMVDGKVTGLEWVGIATATVVAAGTVFGVGNADTEQSDQEGQHNGA